MKSRRVGAGAACVLGEGEAAAFDVDVLYLFPVASVYRVTEGWLPFIEMVIFLVVLALAIVYFWAKGVFTWPRRIS